LEFKLKFVVVHDLVGRFLALFLTLEIKSVLDKRANPKVVSLT
jgi:hypothetical protein